MSDRRRSYKPGLVVGLLCAATFLSAPAASWSQEAAGGRRRQPARLDVSQVSLATGAPQASLETAAVSEVNRSWVDLAASVRVGRKLAVTLVDSTRVEGPLVAIDAGSITVEQHGRPRVIAAAEVLQVRYADARKRHVLRGILVGMATGAVATWAIDRQSSHPSSAAETLGMGAVLIGLPVGAAVGAALPVGPPLYEAPRAVGSSR